MRTLMVPVVSKEGNPLMPTTPARDRKKLRDKKAVHFWSSGVFCIRLTYHIDNPKTQDISVGIDPGSKREAFTVASKRKTYLNVLTDAKESTSKRLEVRRNMRKSRRFRNTRRRAKRFDNRNRSNFLPPSTKARWNLKLRIINWLRKIFPISIYVVEDVCARTKKGGTRWNHSFSSVQAGKNWFYRQLELLGKLVKVNGWETKNMRDSLSLKKISDKMKENFYAHNVDSFVLAASAFYNRLPDVTDILRMIPFSFEKRRLHAFQPSKGNIRRSYGGTISLGLVKGTLVDHPKYGLSYVGGSAKSRLSLHSLNSGKRICQNAKLEDVCPITILKWRYYLVTSTV